MTATTAISADQVRTRRRSEIAHIPLGRVVRVELRKMFDTRSGFWLIASIAITGLIATIATVAFAPDQDLTYYNFVKAVGFPITVILPMVALLSITSEWSQRSGLTTADRSPVGTHRLHRGDLDRPAGDARPPPRHEVRDALTLPSAAKAVGVTRVQRPRAIG